MSIRVALRSMRRNILAMPSFRKSHEIVGSTGTVIHPPVWEPADYDWSTDTPDNSAILRSPTTGEPVQYDGKYWIAYNATVEGIGLAYSTDLFNWTDMPGNPIITGVDADAETWETQQLTPSDFLYMGDEAGHTYDFWLFYKGANTPRTHTAVGITRSHDMISWIRDLAHNPVVNWLPGWILNCYGTEDFTLQKTSTGSWMATYEANTDPTAGASVGAASSNQTLPNSGWVDEGPICSGTFGGNFIANPAVIRRGGTYYCYYERSLAGNVQIYGMFAAEAVIFNLDGWTQMANPVLSPAEFWEGTVVAPNSVIWFDGTFYVYYTGNSGASKAIGLATGIAPLTRYYTGYLTDYQIRIIVNYGAGVDSGEDVYLDGKCRTDFGDIRFTSDDRTELDYWIQRKVDSDYAIIWVKIPSLPASPTETRIYIYYGRTNEVTTESGADTWIDYEDWESYAVGAVLPLGDFEATAIEEVCRVDNNRAYKGNKSLYCDDDSAVNRNLIGWNYSDKYLGGFRLLMALYQDTDYGTNGSFSSSLRSDGQSVISIQDINVGNLQDYHTALWHNIDAAILTEDTWHILEICHIIEDAPTWDFRFDDTWYLNRTKRNNLDNLIMTNISLSNPAGEFRGNLGVCCIGKYIDPEPTHGAWGVERRTVWPF